MAYLDFTIINKWYQRRNILVWSSISMLRAYFIYRTTFCMNKMVIKPWIYQPNSIFVLFCNHKHPILKDTPYNEKKNQKYLVTKSAVNNDITGNPLIVNFMASCRVVVVKAVTNQSHLQLHMFLLKVFSMKELNSYSLNGVQEVMNWNNEYQDFSNVVTTFWWRLNFLAKI